MTDTSPHSGNGASSSPDLAPDRTEAAPTATRFTFQTFDDLKDRKTPMMARVLHGALDEHFDTLVLLNNHGAGVYVTINETNLLGRKIPNIVKVRALFSDLDGAPLDPVLAADPPPHLVTETSPGRWHVYWWVKDVELGAFTGFQIALASRFGSDPSVKDLSRVMRVPGFFHRKDRPTRVRIVRVNDASSYSVAAFPAPVAVAEDPIIPDHLIHADDDSDPFDTQSSWTVLNTMALANLDKWVPQLFGQAAKYQQGTKGYRVSSQVLGREREEDLSIHPSGIKDWGVHDVGDARQGRRSPIDVVMEFRRVDNVDAFHWLDSQLRGTDADDDDTETEADQAAPSGPTEGQDDKAQNAPLTGAIPVSQWLVRELPKPDFICGKWLTTTSRTMLYASTGIGKTMLSIAMAMAIASGRPFLHWQVARPSRVLLIDGEMARRVMKDRIAAEANRLGVIPETMFVLSHEDVVKFQPLNVKEGRMFINDEIERIGGVDFIIFDNIMSLISGDMKEEDSRRETLPWIRRLTRHRIGQMWLHHTGHDASHSYGTKTREWQLDNLIRLETVDQPGIDVSFKLSFEKAREREPANRRDFEDVAVALVDDAWTFSRVSGAGRQPMSPKGRVFYDALCHACDRIINGYDGTTIERWREACFARGLLDRDRPAPSRALFSRYRLELIERNWIACNEILAWLIGT